MAEPFRRFDHIERGPAAPAIWSVGLPRTLCRMLAFTPIPGRLSSGSRSFIGQSEEGREFLMTSPIVVAASRRRLLQYLAASPLLASGAISAYGTEVPSKLPDPMIWAPPGGELIKSPKEAINVFEFEPVARKNVPPAHF